LIFSGKEFVYKVVRIPLDKSGNKIEGITEEIFLCGVNEVEDAKQLTKRLGREYLCYSEWDWKRDILLIFTELCANIYKDSEKVTYYDLDVNNEPVTDYKQD
jgi:hypothetical protein